MVVEITPPLRLGRVLGLPFVAFGAQLFLKPIRPRTCIKKLRLRLIHQFWMYNQTRIEVTLFAFRSGVGSDFRFRVERRSDVTLADPRTGALLRRLFAG